MSYRGYFEEYGQQRNGKPATTLFELLFICRREVYTQWVALLLTSFIQHNVFVVSPMLRNNYRSLNMKFTVWAGRVFTGIIWMWSVGINWYKRIFVTWQGAGSPMLLLCTKSVWVCVHTYDSESTYLLFSQGKRIHMTYYIAQNEVMWKGSTSSLNISRLGLKNLVALILLFRHRPC